jgi:hypothetical protein
MSAPKPPEDFERVLALIAEGKSISHACLKGGMCRKTFYEWRDADSNNLDKLTHALAEGEAANEVVIDDGIDSLLTDKQANVRAQGLNLKFKRMSVQYPGSEWTQRVRAEIKTADDSETINRPW